MLRHVSPVVVVTPTFHPEKIGTPHYVSDLVREFARRGVPLEVVTSQPFYPGFQRFDGYGRHTRFDEFERAPVYRVPTIVPRNGGSVWRLLTEVNFLLQVALAVLSGRVHRRRRVLAVSPGSPLVVLAAKLLTRSGGRCIVVVHDVAFGLAPATFGRLGQVIARLIRVVEVAALNGARVVVVLSPRMGRRLRDAGVKTAISVVPLWPTIEKTDPEPLEAANRVLYSGNLGRKQGVHVLLELAEELARQAPEAELVIRGEGSQRAALVREVRAKGLTNVRLDHLVPGSELAMSLAEAAVHVVPQLPAGSEYAVPSKIYNILAVERPMVAIAEPDSPLGEMAAEIPAMRLVAPGDVGSFAAEVVRLLRDPDERRRIGVAGRQAMQSRFSRTEAAERILELLYVR